MSPYLYRRLMREKLAQSRQGGGQAPTCAARIRLAPRPRRPQLFPVEHAYAGALF
jgi:hypothetical protein